MWHPCKRNRSNIQDQGGGEEFDGKDARKTMTLLDACTYKRRGLVVILWLLGPLAINDQQDLKGDLQKRSCHMWCRKGSRWRERQKWKIAQLQIISIRGGKLRGEKVKMRDAERNERILAGETEGALRLLEHCQWGWQYPPYREVFNNKVPGNQYHSINYKIGIYLCKFTCMYAYIIIYKCLIQ